MTKDMRVTKDICKAFTFLFFSAVLTFLPLSSFLTSCPLYNTTPFRTDSPLDVGTLQLANKTLTHMRCDHKIW